MNNYFQGVRALEQRDFTRAVGFFTRALAIDPADADSQAERGFAYLAAGDRQQALEDCQAALRLDTAHPRGCELRDCLSPETTARHLSAAPSTNGDGPCPANANPLGDAPIGETPAPPAEMPAAEIAGRPDEPELISDEQPAVTALEAAFLAEPPDSHVRPAASTSPLAAAAALPASDDEPVAALAAAWTLRSIWALGRAGLVSTAVHTALLLALAMAVTHVNKTQSAELMVEATTMPAGAGLADPFEFVDSQGDKPTGPTAPVGATLVSARLPSVPQFDTRPKIESQLSGTSQLALLDRGVGTEVTTDLLREYQPRQTTELAELRSEQGRRAAVMARGGTPESEAAVQRALAWLVRHQNYDGSWSFDHRFCGDCKGACANPGTLPDARVGATAMALLPFLGAGHTHQVDKYGEGGKYAQHVQSGLRFLIRSMRHDGGMNEPTGRMYDHGLASIVLCEAYAMTQDHALLKPAERALAFIVDAQDPVGGGWRYQPQMPGDTSVVGWQLMAIKSGQMAYLRVPQQTIDGVSRFLDFVALDQGAGYGYVDANYGTEATSAVGLLCRMYLGWKRDHPALTRGVQVISAQGPSPTNLYFNYYATQVLHHYEGPLWGKWNTTMRDYLVRSQSERGHQAGSWFFDGDKHNRIGGRLYCTALAAMTLEVYYRHMPLYSKRAVIDKLGNK
jgi:hypothetical protein